MDLVTLYETTGEIEWFEEASALTATMLDEFWDDEEGGFFYTGRSHETLIVRSKDFFDNATPAGNSVAAEVLLRIGLLTDNSDYQRRAATILRLNASVAANAIRPVLAVCSVPWISIWPNPLELAIIGDPKAAETEALLRTIWADLPAQQGRGASAIRRMKIPRNASVAA